MLCKLRVVALEELFSLRLVWASLSHVHCELQRLHPSFTEVVAAMSAEDRQLPLSKLSSLVETELLGRFYEMVKISGLWSLSAECCIAAFHALQLRAAQRRVRQAARVAEDAQSAADEEAFAAEVKEAALQLIQDIDRRFTRDQLRDMLRKISSELATGSKADLVQRVAQP